MTTRNATSQDKLNNLRTQGYSDERAKEMVSSDLGHKRFEITDHYVKEMVSSDLGHERLEITDHYLNDAI